MSKRNALYFSLCVGIVVFAIAYCAADIFPALSLPRYYPTLREWSTLKKSGVPAMGWYGMLSLSSVLSFCAVALSRFVLPLIFKSNAKATSAMRPAGIVAAAAIVLMMVYFLVEETSKWILG